MGKKTIKQLKTHTTDEVKRYLGSLSEDFHGRVAAIGEQFSGLNKKIDGVAEDVQIMKSDINDIQNDVAGIKTDITVMKGDIDIIKRDVKKKVDYDEFHALGRRVSALEQKIRK